jgi:hypothetical protein
LLSSRKIAAREGIPPETSLIAVGGQPAGPIQYTAEEFMKSTLTKFLTASRRLAETAAVCGVILSATALAQNAPRPLLPLPPPVVSTVPGNGDVNPYGVAFVPLNITRGGVLQPGDILVSNFNNHLNLQGTGTTIVRMSALTGQVSTFFQGGQGLGLTAALGVLRRGPVFVGNLPTTDGTFATIRPGSLIVLNRNGVAINAITDTKLVNGPWGMAIRDNGSSAQVFISNVLNGTVMRLDFTVSADGNFVFLDDSVQIGSGFSHRVDPAALVLGPSGLSYDAAHDILYVASSADNAVHALAHAANTHADAGTGTVIYQDLVHLHGPLDLVMAPNGHLIVADSDGSNADPNQPSELVEFTVAGQFVAQYSVDPNNGGAFGIGLALSSNGDVRFAAVDDNQNTLSIWTAPAATSDN